LQSAKTNLNVEEVFFSIAKDIKQRLADTDARAEVRLSYRINFHCHHSYIAIVVKITFQYVYQPY